MKTIIAAALLLVATSCAHQQVRPTEPTLRIYLARHGQTDWNLAKRLQGQTDTELNDTGRKQARELAARVDGIELDAVYSSNLRRSRETAKIAAGTSPVKSLETLNEQAIGRFEGLYVDGREATNEAEFNRRSKIDDDTLDGGESRDQFFKRVCGAVGSIHAQHQSGSILIVGHGGTNAMILRCLFSLSPKEAESIHQANDELYLVELPAVHPPRLWKLVPKDKLVKP